MPASAFDPIINNIKNDVMPFVWKNDPNTSIQSYPSNLSIIVTANAAIHHEIERHLAVEKFKSNKQIL